jgi:hypothetical protein
MELEVARWYWSKEGDGTKELEKRRKRKTTSNQKIRQRQEEEEIFPPTPLGRLVILAGKEGEVDSILPLLKTACCFGSDFDCEFRPNVSDNNNGGGGDGIDTRFAPQQIALEIDVKGEIYLHNLLFEPWNRRQHQNREAEEKEVEEGEVVEDVVVYRGDKEKGEEEVSLILQPQQIIALEHGDLIVLSGCLFFRWEDILVFGCCEEPQESQNKLLSSTPSFSRRRHFSSSSAHYLRSGGLMEEGEEEEEEEGFRPQPGLPVPSLSSPSKISSLDGALWRLSHRTAGGGGATTSSLRLS